MFGDNPLVFEGSASNSEPNVGIPEDLLLPLANFRTTANASLTSATTPSTQPLNANMFVIDWAFGATAGTRCNIAGRMPGQYAQDKYAFRLLIRGAKYDADAADENNDLKFRATLYWFNSTATGVQSQVVDSEVVTAAAIPIDLSDITLFDWQVYDLDFGAALLAAGKQIKANDSFVLHIGPNGTVGSSNMHLVMMDACIRWRRHASLRSRADRKI